MRLLTILAISFGALCATSSPGSAFNYPWCLYDREGGVNCGFVSEQQCRLSRGGNADMCMLNGLYQPAAEPRQRPRKRAPRPG